jgi:pSer/pThr/pTyr-binding forkhead associated (FHA) protein
MVGAIFCSECGSQLVFEEHESAGQVVQSTSHAHDKSVPNSIFTYADIPGDLSILVNIMDTGEIISLTGREDFTLGRASAGQPIVPDIDLSPYRAFEGGVSRLHASIRIQGRQVCLVDLGSANGTEINGQKVPAHLPQPIQDGDIVTLGKFKIQVSIRKP